jgi:hypothetical protein
VKTLNGVHTEIIAQAESAHKTSDEPEEEEIFRDLWDEETQREIVVDCLKADCEVRRGKASGALEHIQSRGVCAEGTREGIIQSVYVTFGENLFLRDVG